MEALLVMFKEDGSRRDFPIKAAKKYKIGRNESCNLRIPMASISREHAAIFFDEEEDELVVEDLGSSNGTYVNEEKVADPVELTPGDVLRFGDIPFQVVIDGYPTDLEPLPGAPNSDSADDSKAGKSPTAAGAPSAGDGIPDDDSSVDSFFGFNLDDSDI